MLWFVEDGIVIAGLPVLVSDQVDADTLILWCPEGSRCVRAAHGHHGRAVPAVDKDGTWIRAVSRIGLAYLNEAGILRGYDAA